MGVFHDIREIQSAVVVVGDVSDGRVLPDVFVSFDSSVNPVQDANVVTKTGPEEFSL